jgi:Bacterial regulatory protein, Fis family
MERAMERAIEGNRGAGPAGFRARPGGEPGSFGEAARLVLAADCGRDEAVRLLKIEVYRAALERAGGNLCRTARLLRVHRNTLARELEKYGMSALPWQIRAANRQLDLFRGKAGRRLARPRHAGGTA